MVFLHPPILLLNGTLLMMQKQQNCTRMSINSYPSREIFISRVLLHGTRSTLKHAYSQIINQ